MAQVKMTSRRVKVLVVLRLGGAWIKPAAVIIINKDGVRVEPITGATGSILTKAGDIIGKVVEKRVLKGKEEKKEEKGE